MDIYVYYMDTRYQIPDRARYQICQVVPGRARYQIVPGTRSCQVPDRARYLTVLSRGCQKTKLNLIPGGHLPPQTPPLSRPGGLRNG